MIKIDYPSHPFKIKEEQGKEFIFDALRKAWVRLTPEEWVRQNFLQWMTQVMQYPASLIAIEKELQLGELKKRFDILVYDPQLQPWMLVECKAMEVILSETVLQQALRYNIAVPVKHIVITNGVQAMGWEKEEQGLKLLKALPVWQCL